MEVMVVVVMEVVVVMMMEVVEVVVVMDAREEGMYAHAHGGLRLVFSITFFYFIP